MVATAKRAALPQRRRYIFLVLARTISVLGDAFAKVALAFAVLGIPGDGPKQLSAVLACQSLPKVVFILIGGVVADRVSRSRLMVATDLAGAAAYAGLAAMVITKHAPLAAMCLLALSAGTATAFLAPALTGVVPLVVPEGELQRANGLMRMGTNTATLMGLSLSGVAVALIGAGWGLALNALSFVCSALMISTLRIKGRPRKPATGWEELREGWSAFRSRQWLWVVVAQYTVVVAAVSASAGVLGPLDAKEHLGGVRAWSVIVAAQALGAIAGAGLSTRMRVRRPILVAVLATFPLALPSLFLGLNAPVWACAVVMFGAGVSSDIFGVLWATTLQREVPEELLSRVSSYDWLGSLALAPCGLLIAGPIAASVGTSRSLAGCAVLITVATAGALLSPGVRKLSYRSGDHGLRIPAHDRGPVPGTSRHLGVAGLRRVR